MSIKMKNKLRAINRQKSRVFLFLSFQSVNFVSFSCLMALAKIPVLCWIGVIKEHLKQKASRFSPLWMLAVHFLYFFFFLSSWGKYTLSVLSVCVMNGSRILSNAFSALIGMTVRLIFLIWLADVTDGSLVMCIKLLQSWPWAAATPWTVAARFLCPWGFSRQEYWGGLPFAMDGLH